jgi:hypothetical protein
MNVLADSSEVLNEREEAIRAFLRRVSEMSLETWGSVIERWRRVVVVPQWHDGDRAIAEVLRGEKAHAIQERFLEEIFTMFQRAPWFTHREPGAPVRSTDAAAQYITTTACLALLVRPWIAQSYFETLYYPFEELAPAREVDAAWQRRRRVHPHPAAPAPQVGEERHPGT